MDAVEKARRALEFVIERDGMIKSAFQEAMVRSRIQEAYEALSTLPSPPGQGLVEAAREVLDGVTRESGARRKEFLERKADEGAHLVIFASRLLKLYKALPAEPEPETVEEAAERLLLQRDAIVTAATTNSGINHHSITANLEALRAALSRRESQS